MIERKRDYQPNTRLTVSYLKLLTSEERRELRLAHHAVELTSPSGTSMWFRSPVWYTM